VSESRTRTRTHTHRARTSVNFVLNAWVESCRRGSNRHTSVVTSTGKTTTSRTAQALVSVTSAHLTSHVTIQRLLSKSAQRRSARFKLHGRRAKIVAKFSNPHERVAPTPVTISPTSRKEIQVRVAVPKRQTVRDKQKSKRQRAQLRVENVLRKARTRAEKVDKHKSNN
jgi:hypothetical protein